MKKFTAIMLTTVLCFSFVGCNGEQAEKADTMHKTISIVQNNNQNRMTAEDENYIYFYNVNEILKMSKADNSVETVFTFDGDNFLGIDCIEYFNGALYMIGIGREFGVMQLATVKTDGTDMNKVILEDTNQMPNFYTYKDKLYLDYYWMGNDRSYIIKTETLELELAEREPLYRHNADDGSSFVKVVENGAGKLYKTDANGNTALFLDEDKSVFFHHITDYYVFYILIDPITFDKFEVYRCDLDGNNKALIKEIPGQNYYNSYYDNKYLYIGEYEGPIWKINKETLETTDISGIEYIDYTWQEVNNEKFFYCRGGECYYIDTVTGEKVEFEYIAYKKAEFTLRL